jgi:hypothetical protein
MEKLFALRLISPAGFSRVEVPFNKKYHDIKLAVISINTDTRLSKCP